jgi:hypothetical protein
VPRRKIQPGLLSPADAADLSARLEWLEQRAVVAATGGLVLTEGPGGTVVRQPPVPEIPPTPVVRYNMGITSQTVTNNVYTPVTFDANYYPEFNVGGFSLTGTPTTKLTVPVAGYYLFGAMANWQANATGIRVLAFYGNGAPNYNTQVIQLPVTGGSETFMEITTLSYMQAGGYMELKAFQNSGGNLIITSSSGGYLTTNFWAAKVG